MPTRRHFHLHETTREKQLEGLPLAGFLQRAAGFLIDFIVVLFLWIAIELLWARYVTHNWGAHSHLELKFDMHEWRSLAASLVYFVVVNYLSDGSSLGKWIARTRILSRTHDRIGLWQSVERVFGYAVSMGEGIGFLQFFWDKNRICMHDRMAETIVVDLRKKSQPQPPVSE